MSEKFLRQMDASKVESTEKDIVEQARKEVKEKFVDSVPATDEWDENPSSKRIKSLERFLNVRAVEEKTQTTLLQNREVIETLAVLVLRLESKLSNYESIVGDDASGRLVSLLLKRIIDKRREAVGKKGITAYFLAGGFDKFKEKDNLIKKHAVELGKTLLVTEYILSGENVGALAYLLEKNGVDFDMAAYVSEQTQYGEKSIICGAHPYERKRTIALWGKPFHVGVTTRDSHFKGVPLVHAMATKKIFGPSESTVIQETIKEARHDIKVLAEEFIKMLEKHKNQK